jgi:hypothetical protein
VLIEDILIKINSLALSVNSRYDDSPFETRALVSGNFSRGQFGVNRASTTLGARIHFVKDLVYLDGDMGYDYLGNWGERPRHEALVKSALNVDIGRHHTIYAAASLNKRFGTASADPGARASYEFRF